MVLIKAVRGLEAEVRMAVTRAAEAAEKAAGSMVATMVVMDRRVVAMVVVGNLGR